jgi:hypothetical protein
LKGKALEKSILFISFLLSSSAWDLKQTQVEKRFEHDISKMKYKKYILKLEESF